MDNSFKDASKDLEKPEARSSKMRWEVTSMELDNDEESNQQQDEEYMQSFENRAAISPNNMNKGKWILF